MDDKTKLEIEAAAFRSLKAHLMAVSPDGTKKQPMSAEYLWTRNRLGNFSTG